MNRGFYSGISGSKTYLSGLNVISNNISNVNTNAFKSSVPEFSDLFYKYGTNLPNTPTTNEIGIGSQLAGTRLQMKQGGIKNTENPFDMAISGNGFFKVSNHDNILYTRKGEFVLNKNYELVDANGSYVMGKLVDLKSINNKPITIKSIDKGRDGVIKLDEDLTLAGKDTENVFLKGNLDIKNKDSMTLNKNIKFKGKDAHINVALKQISLDKSGNITYSAKVELLDSKKKILQEKNIILTFNSVGKLLKSKNKIDDINLNLNNLRAGALAESVYLSSDESDPSRIAKYSVNKDGLIHALFNNGTLLPIGRIPLFHFRNSEGLDHTENGYYSQTVNSGVAQNFFLNGNYLTGANIKSGALELSNTDMAKALTDLIIMQKSFNANSKTINVNNELIKTAIGMKR